MTTPVAPPPPPQGYQQQGRYQAPPPPPSGDAASYSLPGLPQPPVKAKRPWYKKKRFISPIALFLLIAFISSLNNDEQPAGTAGSAAVEQEATEDEPTAEELAAQEAEEAEAERIAQEEEAAAAEAERVRQEEEARAAEEAAAAAAAAEAAKGTVSQQNAYESAKSYLSFKGFSRAGLLEQLTSEFGEQFPPEDAEFAIARLEAEGGVDWNAEAAQAAQSYLEFKAFSRQGLIEQLTSEFGDKFTPEQAEYGVSTTGL